MVLLNSFESLIQEISKKRLKKSQLFTLLAEYTYQNYTKELGNIIKVFPSPMSNINQWKRYRDDDLSNNVGTDIEKVIVQYAKTITSAHHDPGKGTDITIDSVKIEIKSSQSRNTINTMLQTSFYKNDPKKFYMFISGTKKDNLTIRIISSQVLYKVSLGLDIHSEIKQTGESEKLKQQIQKGLQLIDLPNMIQTALVTGETSKESKSFEVGQNVKVRLLAFLESH